MSGLHKKAKKILGKFGVSPGGWATQKILGDKTYDSMHPIGNAMQQQHDAQKAAERQLSEAQNAPAIPLPDEEELARIRRRRARGGSRASTNLTDDDRFGG